MFPFSTPARIASRVALIHGLIISALVAAEAPMSLTRLPSPIPRAEIGVEQGGENLSDGNSKISFGKQKRGVRSKPKTFTIKNSGSEPLTGLSLKLSGTNKREFRVTALSKFTLNPGKSTTFKVTFKTTYTDTRTALLQITSNDFNESPFDIKMTGSGVD